MAYVKTLPGVLSLVAVLTLTGCLGIPAKAPPSGSREEKPVSATSSAASGLGPACGRAEPAEIIRRTQIFSSSEADAQIWGERDAGTRVCVDRAAGERFLVFEEGNPRLASWVAITDVSISRAAWERLRPPRAETSLALCMPAASTLSQQATGRVIEQVSETVETFLKPSMPGLTIMVRADFGAGGYRKDVVVRPTPSEPQIPDIGPEPPIWDQPARKKWKEAKANIEKQKQDVDKQIETISQAARGQVASLKGLSLPRTASAAGCVVQAGRELAQAGAPTKQLVLVLDPGRDGLNGMPGVRLTAVRVSLTLNCGGQERACEAGEKASTAALTQAGALAVRPVELTGPFLVQAFDPVQPVLPSNLQLE